LQTQDSTQENNKSFYKIAFLLILGTVVLAYYISNLLFYGKNSLEVYSGLKQKKIKLQQNIKAMQYENAMLQKQYFELKNLEPEEL
jgi:cell division protein FtsB